jgi:hypothetical protein
MAAKDYIWDSQAAKRLEEKELDKHYTKNKSHYDGLAKTSWDGLNSVSDVPAYLKHGDLWDVLLPVLSRDATTLKGLTSKKLPEPMARGGAQWVAWFTHYVVEQFLESLKDEEEEEK